MGKIVMTEEIRRQMAGLLPMNSTSTYKYTPDMFMKVDEAFRPVFEIKQLNNLAMSKIKDLVLIELDKKKKINIKETDARTNEYMMILHKVFVGWTNLYDLGTGELIDYDGEFETMLSLPESVRTDILTEVLKISGFAGGM